MDPSSLLQTYSRIVLLGFMGAGKSTIGPLLASRLGWSFYDTDVVLQERTGRSVEQLFAEHSESGFRSMEAEVVEELLEMTDAVIAFGGGAIEASATRSLLSQSTGTCIIFLDAPLQMMIDRCQLSSTVRPLLKDLERLKERYERRLPHYRLATVTIPTAGMTPTEVAEVLFSRLTGQCATDGSAQNTKDAPL